MGDSLRLFETAGENLFDRSGDRISSGRNGDLVHPQVVLTDMNKLPLRGYRSSTAYLGLTRSSALDPDTAVAQRIAGVQWYWTPAGWLSREDTLPRARLVAEQQVSTDPATDLAAIDPATTALVDAPLQPLSGSPEPHRSTATTPETSASEQTRPAGSC